MENKEPARRRRYNFAGRDGGKKLELGPA